ncbi:SHOCT domain-containing protein [Nocardioides sp. CN2-186]|uniref:SHOCT domain-containing protein n=1 Tax=Nocardioides tweenelious TaxID=3156607 RepID=UPI0032B462FD
MTDDRAWSSTSGMLDGRLVLVELTDDGLHLRVDGDPGDGERIPLSRITGVDAQVGAWTGYVSIEIDGADRTFSRVPKREAKALVEALRAQLRHRPEPAPEPAPESGTPPTGSALEELERLGRLRHNGVLTEAEFESAKATLLKRL